MKFTIKSVLPNCHARVGLIHDIPRLSGKTIETPLLLLHTKGGSIPHLTREVLQMVSKESQSIQIPLTSIIQFYEAMKDCSNGIAKFVGLQESLTYLCIQDPAEETPTGYNAKHQVSVWSHTGRHQITAEKYMDMMEAFQPDIFEVLCDGDTSLKSSKKRCMKSVETSMNMLESCLKRHQNSKILKNLGALGVLEGGYDVEARAACAQKLKNSPINGVVIDGLHNNGEEAEALSFSDIHNVIEECQKHLPQEMLRVIHGRWNPSVVLELVKAGFDIFDSSLAFAVTERGAAFNFKYCIKSKEESSRGNSKNTGNQIKTQQFEISLKSKRYVDDFSPIDNKCTCLTCKKHSKSYIHHLLNTNELLGSVLLMIHNIHYYLQFFRCIRESTKCGGEVLLCNE